MDEIGISHRPKRKPNGITKADKAARKSDDLVKRNFKADEPFKKCVTDMSEVKCLDGKLYVSAVFDCFDSAVLGLAMDTTMKATLCEKTLENTYKSHPGIRGCIIHSDRGTQYTSEIYRKAISKYGIIQSMNKVTVGTITKAITGLTDTYSVKNGETLQLSPATNPTKPSVAGFTYTSMNKAIAIVNAKGMVTANKEGTVKIKIGSKDNRCTKTISLTVTKGTTKYEYDSYQDLYDAVNGLKNKGIFMKEDSELYIAGQLVIGYKNEKAMMSYELYEGSIDPKISIWINGDGNLIVSIINGKASILSQKIFQYFSLFNATNWSSDPAELHISSSMFDSLMQGNYINNEISCIFSAETNTNLFIDDDLVVSNDGSAYYNSKYGTVSLCFWTDDDGTRKCNFVTKQRCFIKEYSVNGVEIKFQLPN